MKLFKKIILILIIIMSASLILSSNTDAIDLSRTTGSLTIVKYEKGATGHEGENTPLKGVEFSIYKVDNDSIDTTTPETSIMPIKKAPTGDDGKVTFSELDLGRYLVVESNVPENVTERIKNFLVDIPQTTEDGKDLNYDVTVYPKNNTAYGTITLLKEGINSKKLQGVSFILQKKNGTTWIDYPDAARATLATNENGQIKVENLPIGDYRFVETSLGNNEGYILDNKTGYEFKVELNKDDFKTVVTPESITVANDKPSITKEIDHISRNELNTNSVKDGKNSADIGDIITYKTCVDIPKTIERLSTYKITDTMDKSLTFKKEDFTVLAGSTKLVDNTDYIINSLDEKNEFILELKEAGKKKLDTAYKTGTNKIELIYNTVLNADADATDVGNKNSVKLAYSNIVNENYKGESNNPNDPSKITTTDEIQTVVYTGGLQIEKRADKKDGTLLSGAVFKLASTKTDANNKKFIKDSNGNEITLTTGENGTVSYKGLSYGKYYLVEIQAPSYEDNGITKHYNLLDKPFEINVSNKSYTQNANIVINRKPTNLPNTGATGTALMIFIGVVLTTAGIVLHKKKA